MLPRLSALVLTLCCLLAFAAPALCAEESSGRSLAEDITASELPMLLDFGKGGNCPLCILQAEAIDELRPECEGKVNFRFVNVIKEAGSISNYSIFIVPTLVFLDAEGKEVDRNMGQLDADDLRKRFKKLGWLAL